MSCGVSCRYSLDPLLLWLWCRPAATAPIWPLTWELPFAACGPKKQKEKKKIRTTWIRIKSQPHSSLIQPHGSRRSSSSLLPLPHSVPHWPPCSSWTYQAQSPSRSHGSLRLNLQGSTSIPSLQGGPPSPLCSILRSEHSAPLVICPLFFFSFCHFLGRSRGI